MAHALVHRGPDDDGFYVEADGASPGIGLVHRRLSIIDVDGGRQPLGNEDGSVQVVFNGEIFNYIELTRDLVARGHVFRTRSDTEVLAHLYEECGDDFVHELNGQFAIALWDRRRRRLLLVRDRPGILPLYVDERAGELLFGSEIKAILAALPSPPSINPDALRDVMTLWAPLSPATLFDGITEVGPGEMLIAERGRVCRRAYWQWRLAPGSNAQAAVDERAQADALVDVLDDATKVRLRADVEVGAFLSGGLDSSVLTSLATRHAGRVRTFSIGFDDPQLDETRYQRLMAEAAGVEHIEIRCTSSDVVRRFPEVIRAVEMPLTRTGAVAMHALSASVRAHGCKVVLTGEGADEVLGGYDLFKEAKVRAFCARQRGSTWRPALMKRLYPSFDFTRRQSASTLAAYFGTDANPADPAFSHRPRWAAGGFVEQLLTAEFRAQFSPQSPAERLLDRHGAALAGLGLLERAQFLEARTLLAGYLLCSQSDRMLMAHSVEGRFPYLDHRVIEFGNGLDARLKIRGLREKVLLKRAARAFVPGEIIDRPKQPYRGPDASTFFETGSDYVDDAVSPAAVARAGYFDPSRVAQMTRKLRTAARERRPVTHRDSLAFLTVLSTQLWHMHFQTAHRAA